tara:strand:+ start:979 stop:1809 length:831 start_codon:yes stop_codon:yes gene_type:complete
MKKNLRIIPKLDIKNYNLVKGVNLEGLRVLGDPKHFIKSYYDEGADEIIYHDVVASLYGRNQLSDLIKRTAEDVFLPLTVGGGIKTIDDIDVALKSGADRIFSNSAFIRNPNFINKAVKYYGSSTILSSIEVIKRDNEYYCQIDFGREETKVKLVDWIDEVQSRGVGEIMITCINNEGRGKGFDLDLANLLSKNIKIPFIVNGGFGQLNHFDEILSCCKPSGIALGSILHYRSKNFPTESKDGNTNFLMQKKNYIDFGDFSIQNIKHHLKEKVNLR